MQRAAAAAPEVFQERMEDLHRFIAAAEQVKQRGSATPEHADHHTAKD
jgi:hypothetical protein